MNSSWGRMEDIWERGGTFHPSRGREDENTWYFIERL